MSLADDSGLFVDALNGAPGPLSARYGKSDEERIKRLLKELNKIEQRSAIFRCAVAVVGLEIDEVFLGECEGQIAHEPSGSLGFGYDPIFVPKGFDKTFADLGPKVKNRISHRAKALLKAKEYLLKYKVNSKM